MSTDATTDPVAMAGRWLGAGDRVALATVTRTWGSAPRQAGSLMAVRADGAFVGSVSGGCVESAVIQEAQAALEDGKVRNLSFGVSDQDAWAVGLACGGTVEINVVPIHSDAQKNTLRDLLSARDTGTPAVLATALATGESRLLVPGKEGDLNAETSDALRRDQSGTVERESGNWFLTVFNPPLDLAIIGAVHIAQPLAAMAKLAAYAVRVIDPRAAWATPERFPDTHVSRAWPDEELAKHPLGPRSAVVALTHDPKVDDPALIAALKSPAFYIGALGSKKTQARRLERLKAEGFADMDLARIRGPVGLNIGARTPAEIAVSVLAEMTQTLRGEKPEK